jgi:hypothetical protein
VIPTIAIADVLGFEEPAPTPEFAQGEAGDAWADAPFLEQIPLHCIIGLVRC